MELVCPYCSAQVAGPPPDGTCPVCGESLAGIEPSVPEAPMPPPVPVSTSVGVVPLAAEEAAPTRTTGPVGSVEDPALEPPVELARELEPSVVEPSIAEDTVVSGTQLLAPEPESEPSWEQADVEGQAKAAFAGWTAPVRARAIASAPSNGASLPGIAEFLALVQNGANARSASSGAQERECPSCHSRVFASADELCPSCGDLLDGGESPASETAPPPTSVAEPQMPERTVSGARDRECPNCHTVTFASADELCPNCGDLLDAPPASDPEPVAAGAAGNGAAVDALSSSSAGATPEAEPTSVAGLRECTHCHSRVFASQDELCPECGDSLEGAPLVEDSQTAAGPIEERDCGHCGARVVGTPTSPCPACGKILGAAPEPAAEPVPVLSGFRPAPAASESADESAFAKTFVGPGAAEPLAEAPAEGTQLCPFCLEEIPGAAAVCTACGKVIRPAEVEAKVTDPDDEKTVAELPPPPATPSAPAPPASAPAPAVAVAPAPARPRTPTLRPDPRPGAAVAAPPPAPAPAPVAAAVPAVAPPEPVSERTVADPADASEATVPDPMASEAELVLGEDPGTSPREERFPSPKIQRSREQVSLPGRKAKPVAPVAAAAAAPTNPTAAAPKAPAPPWAGAAADPVKIMPVRAVAAPPNVGTARGTAAEPRPPKRGSGLLIGIAVFGLAAMSAGAVFVFGMDGKLPGGGGAVATPLSVETTPETATATPAVSATAIASATPVAQVSATATPETVVAPTPVARMSEIAVSTPIGTPLVRVTPSPLPSRTAAVIATPTVAPFVAPTATPVPTAARTPVVTTPPPPVPTPTAVVVVATPTPAPATPVPTQVASVDPRAAALTAAVKQVKGNEAEINSGIKALKRLVKDDPTYADAWFWLGVGNARIEETDDACDAFRKYLKLAPDGVAAGQAAANVKECDR